ncbi:Glutamate synthase domain-containing protein 2 [Desulfocicer vacuolatum DSM 3385]|uniref:Glutamate synthase domain-containing protein 2 n=1 Tax=Desulfocicer vacuolatum DSM 3385 TaxID=1121400 RepID=A0A1W2ELJ4_9BACT|nr:glutamate synthase-related protein [Desulfocicer vacuolatum]SMD10590.1 Glutamate synthase domain-containing protein 2 [Desulfocicer vacuolatum DSM 3385]
MTYSPTLSSGFTFAKNRSSFISPQSGMCSFCTEDCGGTCELAQAAVLGAQTVYPTTTGNNQIASEKNYPIDFSHFNINGRVFGAQGGQATQDEATIFNVNLERTYGMINPVKMAMPVILPALIKLNWQDYFSGAAMAGVTCVIGEDARNKEPNLKINNGQVSDLPLLEDALDCFRRYDRGFGQIVLQCNAEDNLMGVPKIAVEKYGAKAMEIKFGQAAKGTQPAIRVTNLKTAQLKQAQGNLVHPDPSDPAVQKAYEEGTCPNFYTYGRLPLWTEESLTEHIAMLRDMGVENIYFKMAGFDRADIERVIRLACLAQVDMVTFDGAGGGSGYSPSKMMNEWSLPTVCLEDAVVRISRQLEAQGLTLPAMVITGGFASEDQVFKGLAYGDGYVQGIGLCRASMAAAMTAKNIGQQIREGNVPERFKSYGTTIEEIFCDLPDLRALYGTRANGFPTGAMGVFSYLNKIAFGLKHFAALNRKFDIGLLDKSDLIPLTADARDLMTNRWFVPRQ